MYSWRTILAMFAGVVLTAAVVLSLKGMLSSEAVAPAAITGTTEMPAAEVRSDLRQQPVILRAQPALEAVRTGTLGGPDYRQGPRNSSSYPGQESVEPYPTGSNNPRLLDRETPSLRGAWPDSAELPPIKVPLEETPSGGTSVTPSGTPLSPATPVSPADQMKSFQLTRENDSLWSISKERYGDPGYYVALFLHNRAKVGTPDRMEPGVAIDTPPAEELRRLYPTHTPAP